MAARFIMSAALFVTASLAGAAPMSAPEGSGMVQAGPSAPANPAVFIDPPAAGNATGATGLANGAGQPDGNVLGAMPEQLELPVSEVPEPGTALLLLAGLLGAGFVARRRK